VSDIQPGGDPDDDDPGGLWADVYDSFGDIIDKLGGTADE
jgi:hypothetical protein